MTLFSSNNDDLNAPISTRSACSSVLGRQKIVDSFLFCLAALDLSLAHAPSSMWMLKLTNPDRKIQKEMASKDNIVKSPSGT